MSWRPVIVAMAAPRGRSDASTARWAPPALSASTQLIGRRRCGSARRWPPITAGMPRCSSRSGSGSSPCRETSSTPSTCCAVRWRRPAPARPWTGPCSHSCSGVSSSRADAADDAGEVRLGEEPGLGLGHDQGHGVRRWVTSARAARLGTYPSSSTAASTASGPSRLTCGEPLITRETVPRPTPARAATSSSVGRPADRAALARPRIATVILPDLVAPVGSRRLCRVSRCGRPTSVRAAT